ncbi:MATE family efflux transporter (plasmid) [Alkalihalophilus sp. As8PL]|uniref:Probable multidrug resistance protein NorM n=1 Tax=Alkalihalophilus sp. As8PL TaxID=3237103 RepID=A0AB39BN58_9BACI
MSTKDRLKVVIVLALPAVIENFFQTMLGFVDTFFVAQLGLVEVSAVGVTNAILAIYFAIFMAVGVGVNVLMANAIGAGKPKRASHIAQQSLILATILGALTGVVTLIFAEPLLMLMGVDEAVLSTGTLYFRIVAIPSIFMSYMFVLSSILRGVGDTRSPMKATIAANVVNAVLDFVLIFGILFIPALDIVGAALATVISRIIGSALLVYYIKKSKDITFTNEDWSFDMSHQKELLNLGTPAAGERLAMRIGQVIYFGFIVALGTNTFAAHQIAGNIEVFSYMIGYGFAAVATIIVGKQIGAGDFEEAKSYAKLIALLSAGFMLPMGAGLFFLGEWIGTFFTKDPVVIAEIGIALKIAAFFQPFLAIVLILTGAFQGANNTKYPMYLTTTGMWVIRTGLVYVLAIQLEMGITGVWIAIGVDIIFRAAVLWYRLETNRWISIEVQKDAPCHPKTKQPELDDCVNNY